MHSTGLVCHEHYFWHHTGASAGPLPYGLTLQPDQHPENPQTKRRFLGLLEVSGILDRLVRIKRVAYVVVWPHARAWHLRHPEPLLRSVADVERVGTILRDALLAQVATDTAVVDAVPAPRAAAAVATEAAA